jgi:hypothetical protein
MRLTNQLFRLNFGGNNEKSRVNHIYQHIDPYLALGVSSSASGPRWLRMRHLDEHEYLCCNDSNCRLSKLAVRLANSLPNQVMATLPSEVTRSTERA